MNIAIHIPAWVLWIIGVPIVAVVLFFAWTGWYFRKAWMWS